MRKLLGHLHGQVTSAMEVLAGKIKLLIKNCLMRIKCKQLSQRVLWSATPIEPCLENFLDKRSEEVEKSPVRAFWNIDQNFPSLTSFEFFLNLHIYKRKLTVYDCMYVYDVCVGMYIYVCIYIHIYTYLLGFP